MSIWALALILVAAVIHATWNLINKQASGHASFTWLVAVLSALLYTPATIAIIEIFEIEITFVTVGMMAGSAALHSFYFVLLNQAYRIGDLSLVYPLARGTGPLLSCIAAILFLGERPSAIAILGALLIIGGVVMLTGNVNKLRQGEDQKAVLYALLTGLFIAAYTLWDKQAVSHFGMAPLVLDWGANIGRAIFLAPFAIRYPDETIAEWREHKYEAIAIAVLIPLSYILVLTAMSFTPLSYVAPAREISILIGTALGARLLAEGDGRRRLAAAGAMVIGIVGLAVG
ncbi:MAG TPA: EamA family transporter [Candidatus Limnocylindria bacterium]|nr:EamA family transporter [Candidatus Limnocylindria bacterium]